MARVDHLHAQTKRKEPAFGPPRPPPKQQQPGAAAAFGPPRPPPRDAAAAAAAGGEAGGGDDDLVGPPRPAASSGSDDDDERRRGGGGDEDDDDDEDDEDEDDEPSDPYRLPVSNEVVLTGVDRAVTCIDIEHTGSRVVVGSVDNGVRLYDFNGMRSDLRPFREITPHDGHPVYSVSWSPTGDSFLAVTGSAQAKVGASACAAARAALRCAVCFENQRPPNASSYLPPASPLPTNSSPPTYLKPTPLDL